MFAARERIYSRADQAHPDENKASQAVFAAYLSNGKSTVKKWEQGQKKRNGPSLKLQNLVAEKGLDVLV